MLKELFEANKEAFKDTTAKAAGDLLMDAILGSPTLTTELGIVHAISTLASACDKDSAAGIVLRHVAVGMSSNVVDKVIVEIIANGIDVTAPAEQQSAEFMAKVKEYNTAREKDTVFSAAADTTNAQTLPADAVTKPSETFGTSIQDAMKKATTSKMPGVTIIDTKPKGTSTAVNAAPTVTNSTPVCPNCKKKVNVKKLKNISFKELPEGVSSKLDELRGQMVCGTCWTKLTQEAANLRKAQRDINIMTDKNTAAQKDIEAAVASMNAIDKTVERLSSILTDDSADPLRDTIKTHEESKAKHSATVKRLQNEVASRNETIKKSEAILNGSATATTKPATSATTKPATVQQTSGLNK